MVVPGLDSGIRSHVSNALKARLSRDVRFHVFTLLPGLGQISRELGWSLANVSSDWLTVTA